MLPIIVMDLQDNSTLFILINATVFTSHATSIQRNDSGSATASNTHLTQMQIAMYILMAVVGTAGNTLTITVLLKPDFRRRKSSILLLNLAICDVLIAGICIPLDVVYFVNNTWVYGKHLCYVISPFQTSMPIVSSWTFMFMMLERNSLFAKSIRGQMRRWSVRLSAMLTWIVALVMVIPYAVRLHPLEADGQITCKEHWSDEIGRKSYTVILSITEFLVPMLIITVFVIRICIKLAKQSKQIRLNSLGLNQAKRQSRLRQNKNITLMFIVMIAVYASLKLPNNIFWQWSEFGSSGIGPEQKNLIWMFVSLAAYSTSMVNPLVLAAMSAEFRGEFKSILRCHMCMNNRSQQPLCSISRGAKTDSRGSTDVMPSSAETTKQGSSGTHFEMNNLSSRCARRELLKRLDKLDKHTKQELLNIDSDICEEI